MSLLFDFSAWGAVFLNDEGLDPRAPVTSTQMPWSAIGRLSFAGRTCTATLVGKHILVTAAHCVVDEGHVVDVEFAPNMIAGVSQTVAHAAASQIAVGTLTPEANALQFKNDWAVVALDADLGTTYGFMDFVRTDPQNLPMAVQMVGYSGDFDGGLTAGTVSCAVTSQDPTQLTYNHNCSANSGASGGPLFQESNGRYVLRAVHTRGAFGSFASYNDSIANTAVWSQDLVRTIVAFKKKYDSSAK